MYTEFFSDCKSATLSQIIRGRADIDSVIYSDGWRGYDGLVDGGFEKHRACVREVMLNIDLWNSRAFVKNFLRFSERN
ncbi:hypothetical protein FACS1894132_07120 [Clostridia bacterium]|nr:hypothetical protein FACS1894132_07120 [Clostridia bacterium]